MDTFMKVDGLPSGNNQGKQAGWSFVDDHGWTMNSDKSTSLWVQKQVDGLSGQLWSAMALGTTLKSVTLLTMAGDKPMKKVILTSVTLTSFTNLGMAEEITMNFGSIEIVYFRVNPSDGTQRHLEYAR